MILLEFNKLSTCPVYKSIITCCLTLQFRFIALLLNKNINYIWLIFLIPKLEVLGTLYPDRTICLCSDPVCSEGTETLLKHFKKYIPRFFLLVKSIYLDFAS